jgi:hypothetical protein
MGSGCGVSSTGGFSGIFYAFALIASLLAGGTDAGIFFLCAKSCLGFNFALSTFMASAFYSSNYLSMRASSS